MSQPARAPVLLSLYHQYLADQDADAFGASASGHYTPGTLERLASAADRMTRRAAILALSQTGDYSSNATLGKALVDEDRGVRMLAESGIRQLWCRVGTPQQRRQLTALIDLNLAQRFEEAIVRASRLIDAAPWLAESWNQRALALFSVGRYADAIRDCHQALEINPYHFGAASGMGQCHLKLNNQMSALDCFRRALRLNPNLDGVRAHVLYLQRTLKSQD